MCLSQIPNMLHYFHQNSPQSSQINVHFSLILLISKHKSKASPLTSSHFFQPQLNLPSIWKFWNWLWLTMYLIFIKLLKFKSKLKENLTLKHFSDQCRHGNFLKDVCTYRNTSKYPSNILPHPVQVINK